MLDRIARSITRYRLFDAGQHVAVAVSGGADSVCLLHVLRELAPRWDLHLHVIHGNHRLRGAESEADADFVRRLAAEFGLPFCLRELDLSGSSDNLEQAARHARLAFFEEIIANGTVQRVATGHTRSDQAETVIFRFLRGSGTAGLAGIRPRTTAGIVRPLLEVSREEVLDFLRRRNIPWREDSTNRSLEFARNRIRHQLLPQLSREWNPALEQTLAQTADWALAEEAYWEGEIARLARAHLIPGPDWILLPTPGLNQLPPAVARRLVRLAMEQVKGDLRGIGFAHVQAVLDLAATSEGHGRLQSPGLDVMRSFDWLRFARIPNPAAGRPNYCIPATVPGIIRIPGTELEICLELIEKSNITATANSVYNEEMAGVNWRRVSGPLELRNWQPGDQFQPWGTTGVEKIKTLFQQFRIPLWERRHWPVLTDGSSIVWTRRFGPAAQFAAEPGSGPVLSIRENRVVAESHGVYKVGNGR